MTVLQLPFECPGLNPFKGLWFELKKAVDKCRAKDQKDLERQNGGMVSGPPQYVPKLRHDTVTAVTNQSSCQYLATFKFYI